VLGWKVSQGFDIAFVRDLADVRRAIEAAAAASAAERRSAEDIAELRRCLARMDAATASASDFALADLDFHKTVGRASGNVLMRSLAAVIETALLASFRMSSPVREADEHAASVTGHRRIIDAIEAGDPEEAANAMRAIIGHGLSRMERGKITV
jgi:DNA-binding FadR family transcriptional regulator